MQSVTSATTKRVKFSAEEEEYLIIGIQTYGVGKWAKILSTYPFHPSRNGGSLKDKYRNLKKNGLIH